MKKIKLAFQGEKGAYSHIACEEIFEGAEIKNKSFAKAIDFFRISDKPLNKLTYHHVGIYAFTNKALERYVNLERSKLEIDRKLEQLRALENKMKIDVGYIDACPLSVDTETDLEAVKKVMENK